MATTARSQFSRELLPADINEPVATLLQENLVNFIDLALLLKQAHWNVVGPNFRSVHLQLDEIIETTRASSDEIAERTSTLGTAPDGRSPTVASDSQLSKYPDGFVQVPESISLVADALSKVIQTLREAIEKLGELDPVSEDLLIGITGKMEKHLWMIQAQEA